MPDTQDIRDRVRIVLVEPGIGRNVGSVCRAMKTMGITELYIVRGEEFDRNHADTCAVHARDILENAVITSDLSTALAGTVMAGGVTRRRGKWRKYFALDAEDFAARAMSIPGGKVAAVFGSEKAGLSDEDLSLCNLAVRIPSSDLFPSLNLSHAVQIITYELFKASRLWTEQRGFTPIDRRQVDGLTDEITSTLRNIGFFTITGPESLSVFFRDIISRASLSAGEAKQLGKVLKKIDGLYKKASSEP